MKEKGVNLETVHQCNRSLGCKTLHPLVSVIDLSKADPQQRALTCGFYTVLLTEGRTDDFSYGRQGCDYSNASLRFLTPGESVDIGPGGEFSAKGWLLAFHPTLLYCTSLGENIRKYRFFFYGADESLHLSLRETSQAVACLCNIEAELHHALDCHSKILLARHIELLLDYCARFYDRQFITRSEANRAILGKMDSLLDEYIGSGKLKSKGLPSPEYCAGRLHLSPDYFMDMLRFETGKTLAEYFQAKRIEASLHLLSERKYKAYQVAEALGFPSVESFSLLFKTLTGMTPDEYGLPGN